MALAAKPYIRKASLERNKISDDKVHPFDIPAIRNFESLDFHPDVTFFVGENGSGKSTLLEALAISLGFGPEGGNRNTRFETAKTTSSLHEHLKIVKSFRAPKDYYFLRAESFYNVATYMDDVGYLQGYGGKSLHGCSHGESFMTLLTTKLKGNGLYLFDEPEAALSPSRQLAALSVIHELVKQESQFIIATHSPILMAYPQSAIFLLGESGFSQVTYEETEHYAVTRNFLNNYQDRIKRLFSNE